LNVRAKARTYLRGNSNDKNNGNSRFPTGMTTRKAKATTKARTTALAKFE
jgi:hypothetical protein